MNKQTRTRNSTLNFLSAASKQIVTLLLGFVSRWIFIRILGASYLGINGLFANIISVLSMADLGFGSAIVFSMYKPLAENDTYKLSALSQFYKKVYRRIAAIIFVLGVSLVPFLKFLVNLEAPLPHLEIYYLLFLTNVLISYLFSYKMCIVTADQKDYLLNVYAFIFSIIQFVLQIIVLVITKNYIIYLVTQIVCVLANNIYSSNKAEKMYPYIKNEAELTKTEKSEIWTNIKAMFLYKIGGVLLNNTDNILISVLVNTVAVGIYSNYTMIVTSINTFASMIFNSINASVGNLSVKSDKEYQYTIYCIVDFVAYIIYGYCAICLWILLNDFIQLCYGREYILDSFVVILIVINFYIPGVISSNSIFRNATGMFIKTKFTLLFTCTINLILSVVLGKIYGLAGIFMATMFSRMLTNVWYEPVVLHKQYFKINANRYWKKHCFRDIMIIGIAVLTRMICNTMQEISIITFIGKMFICGIVPMVILLLVFWSCSEMRYLRKKIYTIIKKRG